MVRQEPGDVAELGLRSRGSHATAVAIGAHRRPRGEEGVAKLMNVRRLERLESAGGVGVLAQWSVFLIETHDALIRSSVQIACSRPWKTVRFRSASMGTLRLTTSRIFPLGLSPNWVLAICFIVISPTPVFHATSSALLSAESLSSQGEYCSMIASIMPASAAAWMTGARFGWWVENPMNLAFPDFRIASAVSLNSWLLTRLMESSTVL